MYIVLLTVIVAFAPNSELKSHDANQRAQLHPVPIQISTPNSLTTTFRIIDINKGSARGAEQSVGCPQVSVSLTDSDFGDGPYILQAGFAEGESLGATYSVPAEDFPIQIDVMEVLFATSNTIVQTTTHWSVTVWDGTPTKGIQVASFSSDGIIIPHLVMPPGTNGIIISVSVDPSDPDQIYVYNDSGMNSFTVAFRIDQHNQAGSPCLIAPPTNQNAFPTTDVSGLDFPNENWINAISGPFCVCGTGWMTFQQFPQLCTPSGDWVMRASYTPIECNQDLAACCFSDNSCSDLTPSECQIFGGTSAAPNSTCATYICGSGIGACCVPSTGNCVNFDLATCLIVAGIHMGEGTTCADTTCFPEGACCLPTGSCIGPVAPEDCVAVGGVFQGNATSCDSVSCPQPIGACCSETFCLELSESDCVAVGGVWSGPQTTCPSSEGCPPDCPEDINDDGSINVSDLLLVVADWGSTKSDADIDGSGLVDTTDLLAVIAAW